MRLTHPLIWILIWLFTGYEYATAGVKNPLDTAVMKTDATGSGLYGWTDLSKVGIGVGTPGALLHLFPTATTAAQGIKIGSDLNLYRSAANTLTLTGNLVVSGSVTSTNASSWGSLSANNTWAGTQTFNNNVALNSTTAIGTGLTFTGGSAGAPALATRSALALRPGTDIQAYSAKLKDIAALSVVDGNIIVGNGTTWVAESGATARTSLGLAIGTNVQAYDPDLTALSALNPGTAGDVIVSADGATWTKQNGATLRTTLGLGIGADVQACSPRLAEIAALAASSNTFIGGSSGSWVSLTAAQARTAIGLGTTSNPLFSSVSASGVSSMNRLLLMHPLGTISGGTGVDLSATAAGNFLYTSSTGVIAPFASTVLGRTLLSSAAAADAISALGLGTSAVLNVAPVGVEASGTQAVRGDDPRLTIAGSLTGAVSGDLTGTFPDLYLATVETVTPGTYGGASNIPQLTVDAKGRVTAITNAPVSAPSTIVLSSGTSGDYVATLAAGSGVTLDTTGTAHGLGVTVNATGIPLFTNTTGDYISTVAAGTGISIARVGTTHGEAITITNSSVASASFASTVTSTVSSPTPALTLTGNTLNLAEMEGASGSGKTTLAFTNPTTNRTITFPNNTGTVLLDTATSALGSTTPTAGLFATYGTSGLLNAGKLRLTTSAYKNITLTTGDWNGVPTTGVLSSTRTWDLLRGGRIETWTTVPRDYKTGTALTVYVHWKAAGIQDHVGDTVAWKFTCTRYEDNSEGYLILPQTPDAPAEAAVTVPAGALSTTQFVTALSCPLAYDVVAGQVIRLYLARLTALSAPVSTPDTLGDPCASDSPPGENPPIPVQIRSVEVVYQTDKPGTDTSAAP